MPIVPILPDAIITCGGTPAIPTTTDNCAGTISATTATVFPLTIPGLNVITWIFEDSCGNSISVNQNIIVENLPPPEGITGATYVCIGSTISLTEGGSGGTVTWFSSDSNIARVDANGVVTGISSGTTKITYGVTNVNGCRTEFSSDFIVRVGSSLDSDRDGLTDCEEITGFDDPNTLATPNATSDPNNICDPMGLITTDTDGDGLTDCEETTGLNDPSTSGNPNGTSNPEDSCLFTGNPLPDTNNSIWFSEDCDGDGVINGNEILDGTNPFDGCSFNISNQIEINVSSGWNLLDCDGDGVTNGDEISDGTNYLDGCSYEPLSQIISDVTTEWNQLDCDADRLNNGDEVNSNTDPLNPDSDGDGLTDNEEVTGVNDLNTLLDPTTFTGGPTSNPNNPCDPIEGENCKNDNCLTPYNLISPSDGNTENQIFYIRCIDNPEYANNTVEIFNRWGNTVFKIQGYSNDTAGKRFEGISNGRAIISIDKKLPAGTYYYVIDSGNGEKPKTGWLYINR